MTHCNAQKVNAISASEYCFSALFFTLKVAYFLLSCFPFVLLRRVSSLWVIGGCAGRVACLLAGCLPLVLVSLAALPHLPSCLSRRIGWDHDSQHHACMGPGLAIDGNCSTGVRVSVHIRCVGTGDPASNALMLPIAMMLIPHSRSSVAAAVVVWLPMDTELIDCTGAKDRPSDGSAAGGRVRSGIIRHQ